MNNPLYRQYYSNAVLTEAQAAKMEGLFDALTARLIQTNASPATAAEIDTLRYSFLTGLDRKEPAEALRRKVLAEVNDKSTPEQLESAVELLLAGPVAAPDRAQLRAVCRALAATAAQTSAAGNGRRQGAQSLYYYPVLPWQQGAAAGKLPPAELAEVEADLLSLWYPATPPPAAGAALGNSTSAGYRNNGSAQDEKFLPPTRYLDTLHVNILQQLTLYSPGESEWLTRLGTLLDQQARELPAPVRIYPRLVATYLAAAAGDKTRALALSQALLAEQPDDNDLRLLTGVLLGRSDRHAEAVATLNSVTNARYGEAALIVQQQILLNAKAAKDTENARRAALKLINLRLTPEDRLALAADLRELGINDKADQLARTIVPAARGSASGRGSSIWDYNTASRLQSLVTAKNTEGALSLVRTVLAALPPPATAGNGNAPYVVDQVVGTLNRLGKTGEFIADAEKQLAKDPDSLALNYQLAVLCQHDDRAMTAEKRPKETHAAPVWVKLARDGEELVGSGSGDGQNWQEIGRAKVPLGAAPVAALVAASSQTPAQSIDVTMDHVTLTPAASAPSADGPAGAALPAPWTETMLPPDREKSNPVPPSVWRDGVFTLHAAGWDLWGRYDDARIIDRPLGEAAEFVARVAAVGGPDRESKAGVMWRADLTADSPYAAVIILPGGGISFQHRDQSNQATPYWRKVVALQPKEARYSRALATSLAGRGLRDEAVAIYDRLIAADPDEAFGASSDLHAVYGDERLPELYDRILAWRPGSTASNGYRNIPSESLLTVARACVAKKLSTQVIALCRHGIELDDAMGNGNGNVTIYDTLLQALVELKRPDEARDVLLAYYVPPKAGTGSMAGGATTPQLGFRTGAAVRSTNAARWMWSTTFNGDELTLYNLAPLEAGNRHGLLDGLQTALEQRRAADATSFGNDGFDWLLALVQLDRRDPAVLEGLPALLARTANGNNVGNNESLVAVRLEVARRLRQWTGHEALALEAYRAASHVAAGLAANNYYASPARIDVQRARVEMELGDRTAALATLRGVAAGLSSAVPSQTQRRDTDVGRACLYLFLRAGPEADADYVGLYGHLTETEQARKALYFAYGMEKEERVGDDPHYQAMAWLLDDGDGPDPTLVYELRVLHPYDKGGKGRYPGSRARSFPGSEGPRTLTFSYGPDPDHCGPIGRLETANTFGTWRGPVPPGSGVLKVTVDIPRPVDASAIAAEEAKKAEQAAGAPPSPSPAPAPGPAPTPVPLPGDYWLRVVRTPNLMTNPGFEGLANRDPAAAQFTLPGWADLPAGFWREGTFEGPRPGRPYVQCDLPMREDRTVFGARIPVEPGQAYFQSAWLRDAQDGSWVHVGRRYLDAAGNVLKTSECADFSTLIWRWHSQRLQAADTDKDSDTIPPRTAFIEPFIRWRGMVDWTGLFVGNTD